jgi:hypothetical protein
MEVMNFAEKHKFVQLKQHVFKNKSSEDFTKLATVLNNKKELSERFSRKVRTGQHWCGLEI